MFKYCIKPTKCFPQSFFFSSTGFSTTSATWLPRGGVHWPPWQLSKQLTPSVPSDVTASWLAVSTSWLAVSCGSSLLPLQPPQHVFFGLRLASEEGPTSLTFSASFSFSPSAASSSLSFWAPVSCFPGSGTGLTSVLFWAPVSGDMTVVGWWAYK